MKRTALYSRANRRRSATSSTWQSDPRGPLPEGPWPDEDGPSAGRRAWQQLRRVAGRYERTALVAGSVLLSVALVGGWARLHPSPRALTQTDIDGAVQYTLAHTPEGPADTARAAALIAPSVVEVEGYLSPAHAAQLAAESARKGHAREERKAQGSTPRPGGPRGAAPGQVAPGQAAPEHHPVPDKPLPGTHPDGDEPAAIGSGVVVDKSGKVLTALHVVSGVDRYVVVFSDGSKSDADLIGAQPQNDLAVLQPRHLPDELPPATLASTADLHPGDQVVATGFPFGIGPSVSAGVVSGLGREFVDPDNDHVKLTHLIQFDAAVNPGNSGGPLVDREGEVVGIVTAILNPSGARVFAGIGFAVPIENAMRAVGENPL